MTPFADPRTVHALAILVEGWPAGRAGLVQNVKLRLDAWRAAERRRNACVPGSAEWQEAEDEVRVAAKTFHAELAQVSARYAEEQFLDPNQRWAVLMERSASEAQN